MMAEPLAADRRERRRVGALLNAYYQIEGAASDRGELAASSNGGGSALDRQAFDAKRYFEGVVASGGVGDLVTQKDALDAEVQELHNDMEKLVYESYSKFIRATDVIRQMKTTITRLEPDLERLHHHVEGITEYHDRAEAAVGPNSGQIDTLLRQQNHCKKLQVLFSLPTTVQRCLDRGEYAVAVGAYRNCAGFLKDHQDMPTFRSVLHDVELQMGSVREALQLRLRSPDLEADEAVSSAQTLLDLGEDAAKVASDFLFGRAKVLDRVLDQCFETSAVAAAAVTRTAGSSSTAATPEATQEGGASAADHPEAEAASAEVPVPRELLEMQRPESMLLQGVCWQAGATYVPQLHQSVDGLQQLQARVPNSIDGTFFEGALSEFATARVKELCERISQLVAERCPPTRVLVTCIDSLRDALGRLQSVLPRLSDPLLVFLNRTATNAMVALFTEAAMQVIIDLGRLHGQCRSLQAAASLDEVLEEIATTEHSMIMRSFTALSDCQPLCTLISTDRQSSQQLVRNLERQLLGFFVCFIEACTAYVGAEPPEEPNLPKAPASVFDEIDTLAKSGWNGLFALALVRIGRHMEVKAIQKVFSVAQDLFANSNLLAGEFAPADPAVIRATRSAAQAVITHYSMVNGQRFGSLLQEAATEQRNRMPLREPREPLPVIEVVLQGLHACDAELARIMGDPRKVREAREQRRTLNCCKNSMEMEMERLWAKKLQVYAPIPFNRNGAIVGILRIAFKAHFEHVRELTLAKFGLQQLQVDCALMAEVSRDFVEADDASVLESLLDEVVMSASRRCTDPTLMEPSRVEAICDEKKKSLKFES